MFYCISQNFRLRRAISYGLSINFRLWRALSTKNSTKMRKKTPNISPQWGDRKIINFGNPQYWGDSEKIPPPPPGGIYPVLNRGVQPVLRGGIKSPDRGLIFWCAPDIPDCIDSFLVPPPPEEIFHLLWGFLSCYFIPTF